MTIDACSLMIRILWIKLIWGKCLRKKRKFKADTYKVREKATAIQMRKLWNTVMKNRAKILLEPDYIIRNGPVYQVGVFYQPATLIWLGCHVITKLIFVAFNQGAEISVSMRQTELARLKFSPWVS